MSYKTHHSDRLVYDSTSLQNVQNKLRLQENKLQKNAQKRNVFKTFVIVEVMAASNTTKRRIYNDTIYSKISLHIDTATTNHFIGIKMLSQAK